MVSLSWEFDGQTLMNDSNTIITFEEFDIDGVEGTFQLSFLQLCDVRENRNYTCSVSNGFATRSSDIELTVSGWLVENTCF